MNWHLIKLPLQLVAISCAVLLSLWALLPALAIAIGFFGAAAMIFGLRGRDVEPLGGTRFWRSVSFITTAVALILLFRRTTALDLVHTAVPWLGALTAILTWWGKGERRNDEWRILAFIWGFFGAALLLAVSYLSNHWLAFHISLFSILVLSLLLKRCYQVSVWGIQVLNTVILLALFLPIADRFLGSRPPGETNVDLKKKPYLFSGKLGRNSSDHRDWWMYYMKQMDELGKDVYMVDPTGTLPFALRPSSTGKLFGSDIHINSKGFRGREVEDNDAYRIVTIGESTTFGLNLGTPPWSELLEEEIRKDFGEKLPVQVINAGIPSFTLKHNISRLQREILPLRPNMIISYHGINGFGFLRDGMPPITSRPPPPYVKRPLRLLTDGEYGLKMYCYKRRAGLIPVRETAPEGNLMECEYAKLYLQLIEFAETNRIQLVLANFSLAVNAKSPSDLVEFYRPGHPGVHHHIKVNAKHSELVRQLVKEHPGVRFVDTQPELDGEYQKFIDLMHFNTEGEEQMVKAFFSGIKPILEQQLSTNASLSVRR